MPLSLEEAIALHVEGTRKMINPLYSEILNKSMKRHLEVINRTPRNAGYIRRRIAEKKLELEEAEHIFRTNYLVDEIEALQRLLRLVAKHERGEPLEGIAY